MEKNFAFLDEMIPGIRWDAKYATWDNFTGKPVDGYMVNRVMGTKELGVALRKASEDGGETGIWFALMGRLSPPVRSELFSELGFPTGRQSDEKALLSKYQKERDGHERVCGFPVQPQPRKCG